MFIRSLLFTIVGFLLAGTGLADTPDTLWTQTYGGTSNDYCNCVQQTNDGGFIMGGNTYSFGAGSWDALVIKTDATGNVSWSKTFGGSDSDYCYGAQQTTDGGFIIAGFTYSFGAGGHADAWIIKTDANGNETWSNTFGGSLSEYGRSLQQTTDGGFIIAGSSKSYGAGDWDVYLIKADANGNEVWSQSYGGSSEDNGWSVQQTDEGGYIIAGYTHSHGAGGGDVWLIKTDANGNETWSNTFGGSEFDFGFSVEQATDGGYIIAGATYSFGSSSTFTDAYLVKTDANGNETWSKNFGGNDFDYGQSVQQTDDGGYIVGGYSFSYGAGACDAWLIKTDATGIEAWSKTIGGANGDYCQSLQQTTDGGYIVGGYTESYGAGAYDAWLIRLALDLPPATCTWYCGTGVNAGTDSYVITDPAILGGTFGAAVAECATGNGGALLVAYSTPFTLLSTWGEILVNIADPNGELLGMPTAFGNPAIFGLSVPNDPTLAGFVFYTQAASFGGSICLHCAYECTVGW